MPLTTAQKVYYLQAFDTHIYAFPDDSTVAIRDAWVLALRSLIEDSIEAPEYAPLQTYVINPLATYLNKQAGEFETQADFEEFQTLLRKRIRAAIQHLETMTRFELQQFMDNLLTQRQTLLADIPENPVEETLPSPYQIALDDLELTLANPFTSPIMAPYALKIKQIICTLHDQPDIKNKDGLTTVLVTVDATLKNPSMQNTNACLSALNQLDAENQKILTGPTLIFIGVAVLSIIAITIAMSFGAFAVIGIPAFGALAQGLITEFGAMSGMFGSIFPIVQGIDAINNEQSITGAKNTFFKWQQAIADNPPEELDDDIEPDTP